MKRKDRRDKKNVKTSPTRTYCKRNRPLPYYYPKLVRRPALKVYAAGDGPQGKCEDEEIQARNYPSRLSMQLGNTQVRFMVANSRQFPHRPVAFIAEKDSKMEKVIRISFAVTRSSFVRHLYQNLDTTHKYTRKQRHVTTSYLLLLARMRSDLSCCLVPFLVVWFDKLGT